MMRPAAEVRSECRRGTAERLTLWLTESLPNGFTGNLTEELVAEYLEHHRNPSNQDQDNFLLE